MKTMFLTLVVAIVAAIVAGLVVMYAGIYNVAASDPHTDFVKWILSTTSDRSIKAHAEGITAPDPGDSVALLVGFTHYNEMCVDCHGAPGLKRAEFAQGLSPRPPSLVASVDDWTDGQLFWITKNGLKMTGMPGFGVTHSDEQIWDIVAFLRRLPALDGAGYAAFAERAQNAGIADDAD